MVEGVEVVAEGAGEGGGTGVEKDDVLGCVDLAEVFDVGIGDEDFAGRDVAVGDGGDVFEAVDEEEEGGDVAVVVAVDADDLAAGDYKVDVFE